MRPDQTGALFVLTKQDEEHYSAFFLETEEEIEQFLDAMGISPTETNCLIRAGQVQAEAREALAIQQFITVLTVDFPASEAMAAAAREIHSRVYPQPSLIRTNPDRRLIEWTRMEYALFRAIERARYAEAISRGFASVDDLA